MCRSFDSSNPSYPYPEISTVTRLHCTICQVNSSGSAQYPCQALISICGIYLSRPSAFVLMPLGFTSVLTDAIVRSFRSTKIFNEYESPVKVFHLTTCSFFVATARAVLLSALACIRNDSPISFSMACTKINSADSAPRANISDSPLDKATVPCPRHSLVKRN